MSSQDCVSSDNKTSAGKYFEKQKDYAYYQYLRTLLAMLCRPEDSICDVGSCGLDTLSSLPCKTKMSLDLRFPFSSEEVEGIKGDHLLHEFEERLDVITCFQVLEHIKNEQVAQFAQKLLRDAKIAVVSVPYMWPKEACKWHVQDPVDVEKLVSWFGKNPVHLHVVSENKSIKGKRIVAVLLTGRTPNST